MALPPHFSPRRLDATGRARSNCPPFDATRRLDRAARFLPDVRGVQQGFPLRDLQTHAVIGAALEVHREMGCGFLESAYREALALEMAEREVPFDHEVTLRVRFKERVLHSIYRVDFVCFGRLLVEVKALPQIGGLEQAQMINYLKTSRMERGLILNFGALSLQCKRVTLFRDGKRQATEA